MSFMMRRRPQMGVAPKMSPAPLASPNGVSNSPCGSAVKSIP